MSFDWLPHYAPLLLQGLICTVKLLLFAGVLGFAAAVLVGLGRVSRRRWLSQACLAFTSVIRGTPLLVQIFLIYYGLGSVFAGWPAIRHGFLWPYLREGFWYMVIALSISTAGYEGEVIRAALLSVPRGELEAGQAFGLHGWSLLRRIWLPRALLAITPTLAGETVLMLKSTALASTITVIDLLGAANEVRAETYRVYEPLLFVAAGYIVLTLCIERVFRIFERHAARAFRH